MCDSSTTQAETVVNSFDELGTGMQSASELRCKELARERIQSMRVLKGTIKDIVNAGSRYVDGVGIVCGDGSKVVDKRKVTLTGDVVHDYKKYDSSHIDKSSWLKAGVEIEDEN